MKKRRQNPGTGILIFLMLNVGWITNIQAQNGWQRMPDMPTSRAVFKSVLHDGKIYAIGGLKSIHPPYGITTEVYDTQTGEWSVMASMENPCSGLSVEILNNKIYVIGGVYSTKQQYTVIQEYDIETDTWSIKCNMPEPRFNHISEVIDGKIYIAGGLTVDENGSHPGLLSSLIYDPLNNHWDTIADLNHERFFARSCVFNNKIYVFGGAPAGVPYREAHQSMEIYDPETDVWTLSEDEIPIPYMAGMVQVYGESILLFGGCRIILDKENYSCIYKYVPDAPDDKWKEMVSMPVKRGVMAGNIVDHYLHMIGGFDGFQNNELETSLDNHWRLDLDSLKANNAVTGVNLDKESLTITVGDTGVLIATVSPQDATDPSISWDSADPGIVSVVSDGIVEGKAVGMTEIYVTTTDGQFKDTCQVTVTPGVGIANTQTDQFSTFPNPTYDLLTIQRGTHGKHSIKINSLNGQLLFSKDMDGVLNQIKGFCTIRQRKFGVQSF